MDFFGGVFFLSLAQENEWHIARHPFLMAVVQRKELFSIIASDYLKTPFSFVRSFHGVNKMF